MRVIKRYSNRRLYDTETSRTITQFDLARLIREGKEVQVLEAATGEDITVSVLGRVLMTETERWGEVGETTEFLRTLIYAGGKKSMSILKNTILASIGALHVTKDKAEKIVDDLIKKGELDKSDRKTAIFELLEKAEKSTAKWRDKFMAEAGKAQKSVSKAASGIVWATQDDLAKIERKVNRLAKQIKDLQKSPEKE
ncbi:MAG: hypothetical protein KKA42_06960 [candidate division Zixibacteria bacterium]|nr:hypothetical protein [candidate division Zixibacteria bacterium]